MARSGCQRKACTDEKSLAELYAKFFNQERELAEEGMLLAEDTNCF